MLSVAPIWQVNDAREAKMKELAKRAKAATMALGRERANCASLTAELAKLKKGDGGAANFARRSPFPMINLLRTPQVRHAQKGLPTGSVYTTNERNLETVGAAELQRMLDAGDWEGMDGYDFAPHAENLWR